MDGILDVDENVDRQRLLRGRELFPKFAFSVRERQGNMCTDPFGLVRLAHIEDGKPLQDDSVYVQSDQWFIMKCQKWKILDRKATRKTTSRDWGNNLQKKNN